MIASEVLGGYRFAYELNITTAAKPHQDHTAASVTEGHPDKLCDRISDAVLDAIIEKDPAARVAVLSIKI